MTEVTNSPSTRSTSLVRTMRGNSSRRWPKLLNMSSPPSWWACQRSEEFSMRTYSNRWPKWTNALSYSHCQIHPANLNVPSKKQSISQMVERYSQAAAHSRTIFTKAENIYQVKESELSPGPKAYEVSYWWNKQHVRLPWYWSRLHSL